MAGPSVVAQSVYPTAARVSVKSEKTATPSRAVAVSVPPRVSSPGLLAESNRHAADVARVEAPVGILDLHRQPERFSGGDEGRWAGGHGQPGGDVVGGQVGDQDVGHGAAQAGDLVVAGLGGEARRCSRP